jgi:TonB family protein
MAIALQAKNTPWRICVGGVVMSKRRIYHPKPTYPSEAKKAGMHGTVRLEVVIARDGKVQDMKLLSGQPTLAKAAMKAVSKWQYQPSLLSGEPVREYVKRVSLEPACYHSGTFVEIEQWDDGRFFVLQQSCYFHSPGHPGWLKSIRRWTPIFLPRHLMKIKRVLISTGAKQ